MKVAHLRQHPHALLACIAEPFTPVYADCQVAIIEGTAGRARFRGLARSHPEPYGFDPALLFGGPENPNFVVPRLGPSGISLVEFPAPPGRVRIWRT